MKTYLIILFSLVLMGLAVSPFLKRTPEKLVKLHFDINLKEFDYTIDFFEDEWCPNGDGHTLIIIKFNSLRPDNIDCFKNMGMKSLPVSEEDLSQMLAPKHYLKADKGYYLFCPESNGIKTATDFKIFTVDTENEIAVLYYSVM